MDEYSVMDEETLKTRLETCFDLDERLKIRRALRKIRADQVVAEVKAVPIRPVALSSIQKALKLRDNRLTRRSSLTRHRQFNRDGHESAEESSNVEDHHDVNRTPDSPRTDSGKTVNQSNGVERTLSPDVTPQYASSYQNGPSDSVIARKYSSPSVTDIQTKSSRRLSAPHNQVQYSSTLLGELVNGDTTSKTDTKSGGLLSKPRRSISVTNPSAHSLIIKKSEDSSGKEKNIDENDNLLELNNILRESRDFEERRRIRARIRKLKDDMHGDKVPSSSYTPTQKSTSCVGPMTDDELHNALTAVQQQISQELEKDQHKKDIPEPTSETPSTAAIQKHIRQPPLVTIQRPTQDSDITDEKVEIEPVECSVNRTSMDFSVISVQPIDRITSQSENRTVKETEPQSLVSSEMEGLKKTPGGVSADVETSGKISKRRKSSGTSPQDIDSSEKVAERKQSSGSVTNYSVGRRESREATTDARRESSGTTGYSDTRRLSSGNSQGTRRKSSGTTAGIIDSNEESRGTTPDTRRESSGTTGYSDARRLSSGNSQGTRRKSSGTSAGISDLRQESSGTTPDTRRESSGTTGYSDARRVSSGNSQGTRRKSSGTAAGIGETQESSVNSQNTRRKSSGTSAGIGDMGAVDSRRESNDSTSVNQNDPAPPSRYLLNRRCSQVELEQAFADVLDDFQTEAEALRYDQKNVKMSVSSITSAEMPDSAAMEVPDESVEIAKEGSVMGSIDGESLAHSDRPTDDDNLEEKRKIDDDDSSVSSRRETVDDVPSKKDEEKKHKHKHRHHHRHHEGEDNDKKERRHHRHHDRDDEEKEPRQHRDNVEVDDKERRHSHSHKKHDGEKKHRKHKHGDEDGKKKSKKEVAADLVGVEDIATLDKMLDETTDSDRRRELRHAIRVLKRKARDAALEKKEAARLAELQIKEKDDGSVVMQAKESGPQEERRTTVKVKSLRTPSRSELVTKDTTVVTKRKNSAGDEITEVDSVITTKRLTSRGSLYMTTDLIRSKHLKDLRGQEFIEEEVVSSKAEDSISKGETREDRVTTLFEMESMPEETVVPETAAVEEQAPVRDAEEVLKERVKEVKQRLLEDRLDGEVEELMKEEVKEDFLFDITEPLSNKEGKVGDGTTLECKLLSTCPNVTTSWYRDDIILSDSDNIRQTFDGTVARLEIKNMQVKDSGMYRCVFKSGEMELESGAQLNVVEPAPPRKPVILEHLKDKNVEDGDRVVLECIVEDMEDLTVKWFKDDTIIKNDADFKQTFKSYKAKLVITEIFPEDGGVYSCIISHKNGEVKSACNLVVKVRAVEPEPATIVAPDFIEGLKDVSCKDGDKITFMCKVVGDPKPNVTWYKNDNLLRNSADFFQTYDGFTAKLTIDDVFPDDSGMFKCLAENKAGQAESKCNLILLDANGKRLIPLPQQTPPVFNEGLKDVSVEDMEPLLLKCKVSGEPKPLIKWYKDGKILKHDQDFQQTYNGVTAKLDIHEIFPDDEGEYKCIAKNPAGESSTMCYLTVTGPHKEETLTKKDSEVKDEKDTSEQKWSGLIEDAAKKVEPAPETTSEVSVKGSVDVRPEGVSPEAKSVAKSETKSEVPPRKVSAGTLKVGEVKRQDTPRKASIETVESPRKLSVGSVKAGVVETGTTPPRKGSVETVTVGEVKSQATPRKISLETVNVDAEGNESEIPSKDSNICEVREKEVHTTLPSSSVPSAERKDSVDIPKSLADPRRLSGEGGPEVDEAQRKVLVIRSQSEIITPKPSAEIPADPDSMMDRTALKSNLKPFQPNAQLSDSVPFEVRDLRKDYEQTKKLDFSPSPVRGVSSLKQDTQIGGQSPFTAEKTGAPKRASSMKIGFKPEENTGYLQKASSFRGVETPKDLRSPPPAEERKPGSGLQRSSSKVGDLRSKFENMNQSVSPSPPRPLRPVGRSQSVKVTPTRSELSFSLPSQEKEKKEAQNKIASFLMGRTGSLRISSDSNPTVNMSAVDYSSIDDEVKLQKMLTDTQDFDERKVIRQRIRDIRDKQKQEREAQRKSKDEDETQRRQRLAEEDKQRRLNKYQNIAKDEPKRNIDVVRDMAKLNEATKQKTLENVKELAAQSPSSQGLGSQGERLVQLRQKEAEEAKQRKLQTYDEMAKREIHSKTETLDTGDGTTKTITTTTRQEGPDGSKVVTRTQKTTSSMTGFGGTTYGTKPDTADKLAEKLSKNAPKTSGQVTVKTQSWSSKDGMIKQEEKKSQWGGTSSKNKKPIGAIASLGLARPQGARGAMAAFKTMDTAANPDGAKAKPNHPYDSHYREDPNSLEANIPKSRYDPPRSPVSQHSSRHKTGNDRETLEEMDVMAYLTSRHRPKSHRDPPEEDSGRSTKPTDDSNSLKYCHPEDDSGRSKKPTDSTSLKYCHPDKKVKEHWHEVEDEMKHKINREGKDFFRPKNEDRGHHHHLSSGSKIFDTSRSHEASPASSPVMPRSPVFATRVSSNHARPVDDARASSAPGSPSLKHRHDEDLIRRVHERSLESGSAPGSPLLRNNRSLGDLKARSIDNPERRSHSRDTSPSRYRMQPTEPDVKRGRDISPSRGQDYQRQHRHLNSDPRYSHSPMSTPPGSPQLDPRSRPSRSDLPRSRDSSPVGGRPHRPAEIGSRDTSPYRASKAQSPPGSPLSQRVKDHYDREASPSRISPRATPTPGSPILRGSSPKRPDNLQLEGNVSRRSHYTSPVKDGHGAPGSPNPRRNLLHDSKAYSVDSPSPSGTPELKRKNLLQAQHSCDGTTSPGSPVLRRLINTPMEFNLCDKDLSKTRDVSPGRRCRDSSPNRFGRNPSPATLRRGPSPARLGRDQSPAGLRRDLSPARFSRDQSPARFGREQSPGRFGRDTSPARARLNRDESPRRINRDHSPARFSRDHSPMPSDVPKTTARSDHPDNLIMPERRSDISHAPPSPQPMRAAPSLRDTSPAGLSRNRSPVDDHRGHSPARFRRDLSPERFCRAGSPVRFSISPDRGVSPTVCHRDLSPARISRDNSPVRPQRNFSPTRIGRDESPFRLSRSPVRLQRGVSPVGQSMDTPPVTSRENSPFQPYRDVSPARQRATSPANYRSDLSPVRLQRNPSPSRSIRVVSPVMNQRDASPTRYERDASPAVYRREASPAGYRRDASPATYQRDASPARYQRDASPATYRRDASPAGYRRDTSPAGYRRDASPAGYRRDASPATYRRDASPAGYRREASPAGYRRDASPALYQRDVSPAAYRRDTSPARYQRDASPVRYRRDASPARCSRDESPIRQSRSPVRLQRGAPSPGINREKSPLRKSRESSPVKRDLSPANSRNDESPVILMRGLSPVRVQRDVSPSRIQRDVSPARYQRDASPARYQRNASPARYQRDASPARIQRDVSPARYQTQRNTSPARSNNRDESPVRQSRFPARLQQSAPSDAVNREKSPLRKNGNTSPVQRDLSPARSRNDQPPVILMRGLSPVRLQRNVSPSRTSRDLSPARYQRDVSPARYKKDASPERNKRDVSPVRYRRDASPARSNRDESPVRQSRSPVRLQQEMSPSRKSTDSTPLSPARRNDQPPVILMRGLSPVRVQRDVSPSRLQRDVSPVRYQRDASPARYQRDTSPTRYKRDTSPVRIQRDVSPARYQTHRDASPARSKRDESPIRQSRSPVRLQRGVPSSGTNKEKKSGESSPVRRDLSPARSRNDESPVILMRGLSPVRVQRDVSPSRIQRGVSPARYQRDTSPAMRYQRDASPARYQRDASPARYQRDASPARRDESPIRPGRSPVSLQRAVSPARLRDASPARAERNMSPARRQRDSSPARDKSPTWHPMERDKLRSSKYGRKFDPRDPRIHDRQGNMEGHPEKKVSDVPSMSRTDVVKTPARAPVSLPPTERDGREPRKHLYLKKNEKPSENDKIKSSTGGKPPEERIKPERARRVDNAPFNAKYLELLDKFAPSGSKDKPKASEKKIGASDFKEKMAKWHSMECVSEPDPPRLSKWRSVEEMKAPTSPSSPKHPIVVASRDPTGRYSKDPVKKEEGARGNVPDRGLKRQEETKYKAASNDQKSPSRTTRVDRRPSVKRRESGRRKEPDRPVPLERLKKEPKDPHRSKYDDKPRDLRYKKSFRKDKDDAADRNKKYQRWEDEPKSVRSRPAKEEVVVPTKTREVHNPKPEREPVKHRPTQHGLHLDMHPANRPGPVSPNTDRRNKLNHATPEESKRKYSTEDPILLRGQQLKAGSGYPQKESDDNRRDLHSPQEVRKFWMGLTDDPKTPPRSGRLENSSPRPVKSSPVSKEDPSYRKGRSGDRSPTSGTPRNKHGEPEVFTFDRTDTNRKPRTYDDVSRKSEYDPVKSRFSPIVQSPKDRNYPTSMRSEEGEKKTPPASHGHHSAEKKPASMDNDPNNYRPSSPFDRTDRYIERGPKDPNAGYDAYDIIDVQDLEVRKYTSSPQFKRKEMKDEKPKTPVGFEQDVSIDIQHLDQLKCSSSPLSQRKNNATDIRTPYDHKKDEKKPDPYYEQKWLTKDKSKEPKISKENTKFVSSAPHEHKSPPLGSKENIWPSAVNSSKMPGSPLSCRAKTEKAKNPQSSSGMKRYPSQENLQSPTIAAPASPTITRKLVYVTNDRRSPEPGRKTPTILTNNHRPATPTGEIPKIKITSDTESRKRHSQDRYRSVSPNRSRSPSPVSDRHRSVSPHRSPSPVSDCYRSASPNRFTPRDSDRNRSVSPNRFSAPASDRYRSVSPNRPSSPTSDRYRSVLPNRPSSPTSDRYRSVSPNRPSSPTSDCYRSVSPNRPSSPTSSRHYDHSPTRDVSRSNSYQDHVIRKGDTPLRYLPITNIKRNASTIKAEILRFAQANTKNYEGVNITNFSSSWADGLAFCALIHHFHPEAFDFSELKPKHRRHNFTLAFDTAEKCADIAPLLDVDDMVRMKNPDWKCVFTQVQSYYRKFRNHECNIHRPAQPPQQ